MWLMVMLDLKKTKKVQFEFVKQEKKDVKQDEEFYQVREEEDGHGRTGQDGRLRSEAES